MTTFANNAKGDPLIRSAGSNAAGYPQHDVWQNTFYASGRKLAIGDVVAPFINIPAGTFVDHVVAEVLTGEASVTLAVGDEDDPDGFIAAASVATSGAFLNGAGAYLASAASKFYPTEKNLQFTVAGAAATVLAVRITIVGTNVG